MNKLKCPVCGSAFQVDEADYAAIVNQVKNAEFEKEITRRLGEINNQHKIEIALASERIEKDYRAQLSQKELEITAKEGELKHLQGEKANEIARISFSKDSEIALLKGKLQQMSAVKDAEMAKIIGVFTE